MNFNVMNQLPDGFFSVHPTNLNTIFEGPTLIHLNYERKETVLISVMLHGNEHSGFYAIQKYLKVIDTQKEKPERNISILIGNVEAAAENLRFLDGQKDLNRIWSDGDSEEEVWAQKIYKEMSDKNLFAAIDLHNNTGKNPHYCAVTCLEENTLRLASIFDGNILYFTDPKEVFSNYFSSLCPSLTVEAGQSGDQIGISKIILLVEKVLSLSSYKDMGTLEKLMEGKKVYESFGKIKLPEGASISFSDEVADFNFPSDIEKFNFNSVYVGEIFGRANNIEQHLLVYDKNNELVGESYFKYVGTKIVSIEEFYPAMITTDSKIIKQDCLCYILRNFDWSK